MTRRRRAGTVMILVGLGIALVPLPFSLAGAKIVLPGEVRTYRRQRWVEKDNESGFGSGKCAIRWAKRHLPKGQVMRDRYGRLIDPAEEQELELSVLQFGIRTSPRENPCELESLYDTEEWTVKCKSLLRACYKRKWVTHRIRAKGLAIPYPVFLSLGLLTTLIGLGLVVIPTPKDEAKAPEE